MSYIWKPSEERVQSTLLEKFMKSLPSEFDSYHELHKWSIENIEDLEYLRFLELGVKLRALKMSKKSVAVDTKEDLVLVNKRLK